MTFATRCFHDVADAPFRLFCNQFVRSTERTGDTALALHIDGSETCDAEFRFLRLKRRKLPRISVNRDGGEQLHPRERTADHVAYTVSANGRLILAGSDPPLRKMANPGYSCSKHGLFCGGRAFPVLHTRHPKQIGSSHVHA